MGLSLRTPAVALALFAAAAVPGNPQVTSGRGATQVVDILKLPESVWTNINRFVFLVALDVYEPGITQVPYQRHLSKLASYPELRAAGKVWGNQTFPALQKIAADLASDDIGVMLVAMKNASGQIAAIAEGRGDPGQLANHRSVFETQSAALEKRFAALSEISATATVQMDRLRKASKATIFDYKAQKLPPTEFVEVGADPDAVLSALTAANGSWTWLLSDVRELRRLIGESKSAGTEALYARIGLDTWKDVASAARAFMTDLPRQQRFLSGDNYYDNCGPVVEGRVYALSNADSGSTVLSLDGPGYNPGPTLRLWNLTPGMGGPPSGKWQFHKLGKGWWRVTSDAFSTGTRALDGGSKTASVVPIGDFSGQYWRFRRSGNQRGCQLVNSYAGDLSSLTAIIASRQPHNNLPVFHVIMAHTTNDRNQLWELRDITERGF
jgi:hypothetical protein